jgi:hypothetical protein
VKLTIHLRQVTRFRKRGFINPLPHTPSWRSALLVKHKDNFTFLLPSWIWHRVVCEILETLQNNVLHSSSGSKIKPSKNPARSTFNLYRSTGHHVAQDNTFVSIQVSDIRIFLKKQREALEQCCTRFIYITVFILRLQQVNAIIYTETSTSF